MLAILFVMLAEIVLFVPSFTKYRFDYLKMQVERAEIAIQALSVYMGSMPMINSVSTEKELALLDTMGLYEVVKYDSDGDILVHLKKPMTEYTFETYNLSQTMVVQWGIDGFISLFNKDTNAIRLTQIDEQSQSRLVIVMPKQDLIDSLLGYALRIFLLSLFISITTAMLIYLVVRRAVVRPITHLVQQMQYYQKQPEDPERVIQPSSRIADIRVAQTALADLQGQVIEALDQKNRLAALGEAVAKIKHDLRNILASAQLLADRLGQSQESMSQRIGQKLVRSLDRATTLCTNCLIYGHLKESDPKKTQVNVAQAIADVLEATVNHNTEVDVRVDVNADLSVMSDPDYLYRILLNLVRNAYQAIERKSDSEKTLVIRSFIENDTLVFHVIDAGDGISPEAQEELFKPFKGNPKSGGSGLGLPIARDLSKALGGTVELLKSDETGTVFSVKLPYVPAKVKTKAPGAEIFDEIL